MDYVSPINITFPAGTSFSVAADAHATLENLETGEELTSTSFRDFMGAAVLVGFDIVENGPYQLTIPAGQITAGGEQNPVLTLTFDVNDPELGGSQSFPQISLISSDPASGSKFAVVSDMSPVKFVTSDDAAVNYIAWTLYDVTDPENPQYVGEGNENRCDPERTGDVTDQWEKGLFVSVANPDKMVEGHTYEFSVKFCGIGSTVDNPRHYPSPTEIAQSLELETSLTFYGLTKPEQYSPYTVTSVSPDPETYVIEAPEEGRFTVTYSGPVKVTEFVYPSMMSLVGAGTFEALNPDADGYADMWEFTFTESVLEEAEGGLYVNIAAKDADGLPVKGNSELEFGNYYYSMDWKCNIGADVIVSVSPVNGATVESLSEIIVSNHPYNDEEGAPKAMYFCDNNAMQARIVTMEGAEVAVLNPPVHVGSDETQMKFSFDPITASGSYILMIDAGYFNCGTEYNATSCSATSFRYFIDNGESGVVYDMEPESVTPGNYAEVESIQTVVVDFGTFAVPPMNAEQKPAKLYKYDYRELELVAEVYGVENDWFNPTSYTFTFSTPIIDEGMYIFRLEEGTYGDDDFGYDGTEGHANPELNYTFIISLPASLDFDYLPASVTPEDGATVEVLSSVVLSFDDLTFTPWHEVDGVYLALPGKFYKATADGDVLIEEVQGVEDDWFNPTAYTYTLSKPVSEIGTYKLVFDEATFCDENYDMNMGESGRANPALVYTYYIGTSGVSAINGLDGKVTVVSPDGVVLLNNADAAELNNLPEGLYIVNGKKLVIRK